MQNDQVEVLLKEYEARRAEINVANTQYRQTVGLSYLYLPAIVTATGLFSSVSQTGASPILSVLKSGNAQELWLTVLILATLMGFSLYANALDSLGMIFLQATRCARIEQHVNEKLGSPGLLNWDSSVVPSWFSGSYVGKGAWIKPNVLLAVWSFLFIAATNGFLCAISFVVTPSYGIAFSLCVLALTLFNLLQWLLTLTTGTAEMRRIVFADAPIAPSLIASFSLSSDVSLKASLREAWPIVVVSVLFGPLPLAIIAALTNSFWPSSPHPFSYVKFLSIVIGDTLFLPIFNGYAYRLFRNRATAASPASPSLTRYVVGTITLSLAAQYWIHCQWSLDQYTGFMDLVMGRISFGGWWHLVYAGFETATVLLYAFVWITALSVDEKLYAICRAGWRWFIWYCVIGIGDSILHRFTVFAALKWGDVLAIEWPNIVKLILALVLMDLFHRVHSRFFIKHAELGPAVVPAAVSGEDVTP